MIKVIIVETPMLKLLQAVLVAGIKVEEHSDTIAAFSADFGDGIEAEIKVCNGEPPFVDAVLYHDGNEVAQAGPSDALEELFSFTYGGEQYMAVVAGSDQYGATQIGLALDDDFPCTGCPDELLSDGKPGNQRCVNDGRCIAWNRFTAAT